MQLNIRYGGKCVTIQKNKLPSQSSIFLWYCFYVKCNLDDSEILTTGIANKLTN